MDSTRAGRPEVRKWNILILTLCSTLIGCGSFFAAPTVGVDFNIIPTNPPITLSQVQTVANLSGNAGPVVVGNYLYIYVNTATGVTAFEVWDVSKPQFPNQVGNLALTGTVGQSTMVVSGGYAYIGQAGSASLPNMQIVDVRNPVAPVSVFTSANTATTLHTITDGVRGGYWYVVDQNNANLLTFDVTNPASPSLANTAAIGNITPVGGKILGNFLYVITNSSRLVVFDLANPAAPASIANIATGAGPGSIDGIGNVLVIGRAAAGVIELYNVATPASPAIIGTAFSLATSPVMIQIVGKYAYIGSRAAAQNILQIKVVDISVPTAPVLVGTTLGIKTGISGNVARRIWVSGNVLYFATTANSITYFESINLLGNNALLRMRNHLCRFF